MRRGRGAGAGRAPKRQGRAAAEARSMRGHGRLNRKPGQRPAVGVLARVAQAQE